MADFDNGLRNYALHTEDPGEVPTAAVAALAPRAAAAIADPQNADLSALSPEAAARRYIENASASPALPEFTSPADGSETGELKILGTESLPLTETITCKFRQYLHGIPVYGSLVTVEMDQGNYLLALNSSLGEPGEVSPVASISPAEAIRGVRERAGYQEEPLNQAPRLFYYYDSSARRWRLAWIVEDVPVLRAPDEAPAGREGATGEEEHFFPLSMDYVIDAHDGDLVAELPRTSWVRTPITTADALGVSQNLFCERDPVTGNLQLQDRELGASTFDFGFADIDGLVPRLPGPVVTNPPTPWVAAAISAQANALRVLTFYRETLRRDSVDGRGFPLRSSINCVSARLGAVGRSWRNAVWNGRQMIYGQVAPVGGGPLRTLATALDVVAHEISHGLTQFTARLEYLGQTGAMNESYSDIFGILVANEGKPISTWSWELGAGLGRGGGPFRDMSNPGRTGQPADMAHFVNLPADQDFGGVHTNSGIHNKAAFNLITAKDATGNFLFTPRESAALFYMALTQHLSRTSGFSDSRRGVELTATTLFRNDARRAQKLAAIRDAFDHTGIV